MNAVVSRLLSLGPKQFLVNPSVSVLSDLNTVADLYTKIGPIPSALLLNKICEDSHELKGGQLHPVHQKALNSLIAGVSSTVSHLPGNLAIQTFNRLASVRHPSTRTMLASMQDKWFENWNTASVAKGKGRPRKKQETNTMYGVDTVGKIRCNNSNLLKSLEDTVLSEAIKRITQLKESGTDIVDLGHIMNSLIQEYELRRASGAALVSEEKGPDLLLS